MSHYETMAASEPSKTQVSSGGTSTFSRAGKPYDESWQTSAFLSEHFFDDVAWTSGWLHEFVCPDCPSFLRFMPDAREHEKGRFQCPKCGKWSSGDSLCAAWVYLYRQWYAEQLMVAATSADKPAAAYCLSRFIDFYASNYREFPIHGNRFGQGKIMAQSLDEAVFGIHLVRALHYCKELVQEEQLLRWRDELFYPMAELLKSQADKTHNISVWIWCFVGMVGVLYQDDRLISESEDGEYGLARQLGEGLTKDYLWREGSPHYHYYVLEAQTLDELKVPSMARQ